jgi:anti-anti-sigma factor
METDDFTDDAVLMLSGELDVRSTSEVRNAIYDHLDAFDGDIVIDVSQVTSVDLTALKVVAAASRRANRAGQHIVVRGACPAFLRMLHLSHLIRFIELEREPVGVPA